MEQEADPPVKGKLQAYRRQGHYNPSWTYARGTRRERLQALAVEQEPSVAPHASDADTDPTMALDLQWYVGEDLIQRQGQPWVGIVGQEADYNTLEECDFLTMDAIWKSGRLPRVKGGFNLVTPSYLTIVLYGIWPC